jgi:hypothetical protein
LLFLAILVVVSAVAIALIGPLVRRPRAGDDRNQSAERAAALEAQKEAKYREILDAEADFKAGKLSEEDYGALDRTLRREALAILREIDDIGADQPESGESARGRQPPEAPIDPLK